MQRRLLHPSPLILQISPFFAFLIPTLKNLLHLVDIFVRIETFSSELLP